MQYSDGVYFSVYSEYNFSLSVFYEKIEQKKNFAHNVFNSVRKNSSFDISDFQRSLFGNCDNEELNLKIDDFLKNYKRKKFANKNFIDKNRKQAKYFYDLKFQKSNNFFEREKKKFKKVKNKKNILIQKKKSNIATSWKIQEYDRKLKFILNQSLFDNKKLKKFEKDWIILISYLKYTEFLRNFIRVILF